MKYCESCRREVSEEAETCTFCGNETLRDRTDEDRVFLVKSDADDCAAIEKILSDNGIPFETGEEELRPDGSVYSGKGIAYEKEFFVPAGKKEMANALLDEKFKPAETFEEMKKGKRIWVQIVSVLLFILVIAAVVYAADWVAMWLKSLIS